jgi:hypothetical protein
MISPSLLENIFASAIFFGLGVILLVTLLPVVLKHIDNRKWKPMRKLLVEACNESIKEIIFSADSPYLGVNAIWWAVAYTDAQKPELTKPKIKAENIMHYSRQNNDILNRIQKDAARRSEDLRQNIKAKEERFRTEIVLYLPALNPDLASLLAEFLRLYSTLTTELCKAVG